MRFRAQSRPFLRGPAAVAIACATLCLTGCSAGLKLRVSTAHNLNSPSSDRGHRLAYRIVQFKEMPSLAGSQFPSVWRHEAGALPGVVGEAVEGTFDPDTMLTLKVKRAKGAKAFAIIGNFYKPQGECWYIVRAFGKGSKAVVNAGPSCFSSGAGK